MPGFIFLDLETTGLEIGVDQITEAAWCLEDGQERQFIVDHTRLPNDWVLHNTDYLTRIAPVKDKTPLGVVLGYLATDCRLAYHRAMRDDQKRSIGEKPTVHIVGANPAFDDRFLREAHRVKGLVVPYDYHLVDVEVMAFGAFGLRTVPHLKEIRGILGLPGWHNDAHTALGDAREVKLAFDTMRGVKDVQS